MVSVNTRENHARKFEDSKINLLDLPIRDDLIQTKGNINLLIKPPTNGGFNPQNNRRFTGNTTISSSNSLKTAADLEPG
jgi:hypothetical protein